MKKRKRALVTGGSGFIGRHLVKELYERGYEVSILDRSPRKISGVKHEFVGDIVDKDIVKMAMNGQDVVYHLAGVLGTSELQESAYDAMHINLLGSINVFDSALVNKTKVILISKPNPWSNIYSLSKETSERVALMYGRDFAMKVTIVKWFNVYGPGQKHYGVQKAVPTFIVNALQNKPLPVWGSGRQTADFIYVTDTAYLTVEVAESKSFENKVVEIGCGKGITVLSLAKKVIGLTKSKSEIKLFPMRLGEPKMAKISADLRMVRKLKSFRIKVGLEQGLMESIKYYKQKLESENIESE